MHYVSTYDLDRGPQRRPNQDAMLLTHALCGQEEAVLAVLCDGVGGLERGEWASAIVVRAFRDWFREWAARLCAAPDPGPLVLEEWSRRVGQLHQAMKQVSEEGGYRLGTTLEALLLLRGRYYICHVGDCRTYRVTDVLDQLTCDHTVVQQEIDAGRLTREEPRRDSRQSLLWQCVGAGRAVQPDLLTGEVEPGQAFLLCCDGFRRRVSERDMRRLGLTAAVREKKMHKTLRRVIDTCRRRGERDNITGILICEKEPPRFAALFRGRDGEAGPNGFRLTKDILIEHTQPDQATG